MILTPGRLKRSQVLSDKIFDFLQAMDPQPLGGDVVAAFLISALGMAKAITDDPRAVIETALDEWEALHAAT